MFNKSISAPFPTSHLDLRAMTSQCKFLRACTCITLLNRYSCKFLGHHPLRVTIFLVLFCILTHSCLLHPPHLTRISGPLSTKRFLFLACIFHRSAPGIVLTSHVVKSIHHNTHISSPDLFPRATSVCMPLSHCLPGLCRDISHTCTGMFEILLLHPYYVDDLWTSVHHPDMGTPPVPPQLVNHIGVSFKLFSDSLKQ